MQYLREQRLEKIRRSCLRCGHLHFNDKPCCSDPFCVSDLKKASELLTGLLKRCLDEGITDLGLQADVEGAIKGFNLESGNKTPDKT